MIKLYHQKRTRRNKMKDLKKKSVSILCNLGKFGVGKSLTLGMYDVPIPKEMKRTSEINTTRNCEKSLT